MAVSDILGRINRIKPGKVFTSREMLKFAPRNAVDKTLHHLNKAKVIKRVGFGVYTPGDGTVLPTLDEIVKAKAHAFNRKVVSINRRLARRLREDADSNAEGYYATDGSTTKFWTCHGLVQLIHVAPRKEVLGDSNVGVELRTLCRVGRNYLDQKDVDRVCAKWTDAALDECSARIKQLPQWLSTLLGMPNYRPGAAAYEFP